MMPSSPPMLLSMAASVRNWPRMGAAGRRVLFSGRSPGALSDGHQHDVHDADAAHQQGEMEAMPMSMVLVEELSC